jgi:hypothetical protein
MYTHVNKCKNDKFFKKKKLKKKGSGRIPTSRIKCKCLGYRLPEDPQEYTSGHSTKIKSKIGDLYIT